MKPLLIPNNEIMRLKVQISYDMADLEKKMGVFGAGWKHGQIWSSVKTAHAGVAMTKRAEVKEEME